MDNYFDVYVKLMQQAAVGLEHAAGQLLKMFKQHNLDSHPAYKELQQTIQKSKITYSNQFTKYYENYVKQDPEIVAKLCSLFESRTPGAPDEEVMDHVKSKVYQSMEFKDLMKFNSEDLPVHALLEKELRTFAAVLMTLWFSLFTPMYALQRKLVDNYQKIHRTGKEERLLQQIIGSREIDPELGAYNKEDISTVHRNIARTKRNSGFFKQLLEFSALKVEDEKLYLKAELVPIIFEETFLRFDKADEVLEMTQDEDSMDTAESLRSSPFRICGFTSVSSKIPGKKKHRFVFLSHGFQACHYDMLKMKHYFSNYRPDARFYCIKSNEEKTTEDIGQLGLNLANEVNKIIEMDFVTGSIESISFIGHSMGKFFSLGGLIIRSALPHLEKYKSFFKTYMSFSSPHLGVSAGDSKLVEAGFNILTSWKQFTSLKQMGLKDSENYKEAFLFQLSNQDGFNWFKEVILVSSPQDTYSPYDSSRIQLSKVNSSSKSSLDVYGTMVENINNKLRKHKIRRVDVCMKFEKSSLDTFIGRAAHIALITDGIMLDALAVRYSSLF